MPVTLSNPYALKGGRWFRGNLHTHTTESDGTRDPQAVVDDYRRRGYDFLMISDHDKITPTRGLKPGKLLLIPGNEISARGPHMLHVNTTTFVEPTADRQRAIDRALKTGSFVVLNHPNWQEQYNHCSLETLRALKGYIGIEIFNGVCDRLDGSAFALDKWDRIQNAARPIWGFANDDSHRDSDVELGWNMVLARKNTVKDIVAAMQSGSFYASTGVVIRKIAVHGAKLTVVTANAQRLAVYSGLTRLLARVDGSSITFDAAGVTAPFIRVECYGIGGRTAWTQPFFLKGIPASEKGKLLAARPALNVQTVPQLPPLGQPDGAWRKALSHSGFLNLKTCAKVAAQTHLKALCDGNTLAFQLRCIEPAMNKIRTPIRKNGDPSLWSNDGVEIFLDVDGAAKAYWHVMINANGYWYAGRTDGDRKLKAVQTWAGPDEEGYLLEIRLPLRELGGRPDLNRWRFNLGRNRVGAGETSSWKWVGEGFHHPEHFGVLKLRK